MERTGYRRSDSRPGYWMNGARSQSSQGYIKDRFGIRFRSQSKGVKLQSKKSLMNKAQGGYSLKSGERPKSDIAKYVELIKIEQKEVKNRLKKMNEKLSRCEVQSKFMEEEVEIDVKYIRESEGLKMIINRGYLVDSK